MAMADLDELMARAISIVKSCVGKGCSEENYRKFKLEIERSAREGGIDRVKHYITMYIMNGMGFGVIEGVEAIADLVNEDVNEQVNPLVYAESYVFYQHDGPVTPFVALSRTLELVANGRLKADEAANFLVDREIVSV